MGEWATTPYMAQGAVQAIEDAALLAKCLEQGDSRAVRAALQRYEQTRQPRASKRQELSPRNGVTYHLADGEEQRKRDANLSATTALLPQNVAWLYGHDCRGRISSKGECPERHLSRPRAGMVERAGSARAQMVTSRTTSAAPARSRSESAVRHGHWL
jgi:hypothetical protein